jgi:hypothetical protein
MKTFRTKFTEKPLICSKFKYAIIMTLYVC